MRLLSCGLLTTVLLASPAMAATYTIDNNHTSLGFDVVHLGIASVAGRFNTIAGTFDLSEEGVLSNINITIDVNSVDTKVQRRDDHLRTADFFNVAEFPTITFVSDSVERISTNAYSVVGNLTMMNVTKRLEAVVTHNGTHIAANGVVKQGATVRFTVKRSEFGMTGYLSTISDEVNVVFSTEAVKS